MKPIISAIFSGVLLFNSCLIANAQVLDVLIDEDPILRTVCCEVQNFDEKLDEKIANLKETLEKLDGAGLAANQVGYTERFFVVSSKAVGKIKYCNEELKLESDQPLVFINPRIIKTEGNQIAWEGCFSLKGYIYRLIRPMNVLVEAFDVHGNPFSFETNEFWAKCICHEYDHLDGKLCKDQAIEVKPYPNLKT